MGLSSGGAFKVEKLAKAKVESYAPVDKGEEEESGEELIIQYIYYRIKVQITNLDALGIDLF